MTSTLLQDAGEALYGGRWQSDLARDLGVSDRTMRRWVSGADNLPPGVAADLGRLCEQRIARLDSVSRRLRAAAISDWPGLEPQT